MKRALLLIDIQNDYFPGGRCELFNPEQAAEKARLLLAQFRSRGLPVLHVQHVSEGAEGGFFLPGTEGVNIHSSVLPQGEERVLIKHSPNSFLHTGLEALLRELEIGQLVVCGMMSHMCVDSTVRAASDLGFSVLLAEDACTTKALSCAGAQIPAQTVHRAFMAALNGPFAQVIRAGELF